MFRPHIFNQIYIYYKVLHTKNTKCHFLWKIFMFGSQILDMFDILDFQCFLHICCLACWLTKHQIASSEGGVTVFQNLALSPLPPQSGWPNKRCWGLQSRRKKEAGQKIRMQKYEYMDPLAIMDRNRTFINQIQNLVPFRLIGCMIKILYFQLILWLVFCCFF